MLVNAAKRSLVAATQQRPTMSHPTQVKSASCAQTLAYEDLRYQPRVTRGTTDHEGKKLGSEGRDGRCRDSFRPRRWRMLRPGAIHGRCFVRHIRPASRSRTRHRDLEQA